MDEPEPVEVIEPEPEPKPARKRWWRWLWRIPLALVGVVFVAVLGVLAAVLWIPAASQLAARMALERWDAAMPGAVRWSDMSGRLGDGLRIDDLELRDDLDRPLVRVARVELDVDALQLLLLRGVLELGRLEDAEVWVDHEFRALSPTGDEDEDEDEDEDARARGMGVDLPLPLRACVEVDGARVHRDERVLVHARAITVCAHGFGREAEAELTITGVALPEQDLRVTDLELVAAWSAPVVELRTLDVDTPLGWATLDEPAVFDARARRGGIELHVEGDLDTLAARLDIEQLAELDAATADIAIEYAVEHGAILRGQARFGEAGELALAVVHFDAAATSLSPPNARALAELSGPGTTGVVTFTTGDGDGDDDGLATHLALDIQDLGALGGALAPRLGQPKLARLRGQVEVQAACVRDDERLRCPVRLRADTLAGYGARVGHAELRGELLAGGGDALHFDVRLAADDLMLKGRSAFELNHAVVTARGAPKRFHVDARARGPEDHGTIGGWVSAGTNQQIELELEHLRLVSTRADAPATVELLRPARIVVGPDRVDVHELELGLVGGSLHVDGHLDLEGAGSELSVELREIELGRIDALLPGPHMRGRLQLRAAVRGGIERPAGWLDVDARDLMIADIELGALNLTAQLCGPRAASSGAPAYFDEHCHGDTLRVSVHGGGSLVERYDLDARLPVAFAPQPGLRSGPPLEATVALRGLDLAELAAMDVEGEARLIPELEVEGAVDVDVDLAGTASVPELDVQLVARELVVDRTAFGSLLMRTRLEHDRLAIDLDIKPGFCSVELDASVPVHVDLARPAFALRPSDEHLLSVELHDLELHELADTLGPKLPALEQALAAAELDALVSASIRGRGNLDEPELFARVRAHGLRHRDAFLGHARADIDTLGEQTSVVFVLDGPLAERIDARVVVPMRLALRDRELPLLQIDDEAPVHAEVHVAELSLANLEPHVGELPFAGEASVDAELSGSIVRPQLDLAGSVSALRRSSDPVGDLGFHAHADTQIATLGADIVREGVHILALELELPIDVALEQFDEPAPREPLVRWARERSHRLLLAGRGIDDDLLVALGGPRLGSAGALPGESELATEIGFDLGGGGMIDDFRIRGRIHGTVREDGETSLRLDGMVELDERRQIAELQVSPSACDEMRVHAELDADVPALLDGRQQAGNIPFTLAVDATELHLDTLGPVLPAAVYGPEGTLRARIRGDGTLAAPKLRGALQLDDAAIVVLALRQRVRNINLDLRLDGNEVALRRLDADVGTGHISGHGDATVFRRNGLEASVTLDLDEVPIVRAGLPLMTASTEVDVELELDPEDARLEVGLANLEVVVDRLHNAAPKRIPHSDAIDFVAELDTEAPLEDVQDPEVVDTPDLDFHFVLRDPAFIHGQTIDMVWAGSMAVLRRDAGINLEGELEAQRGTIEVLGHRFELRRGIVTMVPTDELMPYLDIAAVTSTAEGEVEMTVTGRADAPELHFSSGALDEYQIVTLLVTGSSSMEADSSRVEAKAAGLLAAISSPQLQRQLDRTLGIDRARIRFGDTIDQPILTLGKRITENVMVETTYHHNAPKDENTAELGVEYNFARRWSLQTFFGDAAVGGIGVYWTKSFPTRRRSSDENDDDDDSETGHAHEPAEHPHE